MKCWFQTWTQNVSYTSRCFLLILNQTAYLIQVRIFYYFFMKVDSHLSNLLPLQLNYVHSDTCFSLQVTNKVNVLYMYTLSLNDLESRHDTRA